MTDQVEEISLSASRRYVPRFVAVGALGTLLDIGLFTVMHIVFGMPALAANTLSYSAGIANNYILHRVWTYSDRPRQNVAPQFAAFAAVSLAALLLNNMTVLALTAPFTDLVGQAALGALLAKGVATGIGVTWNFLANTFWTFKGQA
jgi:putative flippase GtrA